MVKFKYSITLLILVIILSGCSDTSRKMNNENSNLQKQVNKLKDENSKLKNEIANDENQKNSNHRYTDEVQIFSMNEPIKFGDKEKELAEMEIIEVTSKQSAFPKQMIKLENYDTKHMISIKIKYKNLAMKKPFLPYAQSFQAYSKEGMRLELVNQQIGQNEVPEGKEGVTQIFWEFPLKTKRMDKVEIDFNSENHRVATFDLNVAQ